MNIIISNYDDIHNPYYGGGGAIAIHEIAKRLAQTENVTVITGNYPNAHNQKINNVTYKRVGTSFGGPIIGQLTYHALLWTQLFTQSFDIWIESFVPPWSTSFLPFFTKKPIIGLTHLLGGKDMTKKYKLPFDKIEHWGLQKYKHVIGLTPYIANEVSHINPKIQTHIIPNGINLPNQTTSIDYQNFFLYIGRIDFAQKGLDLLIRAFVHSQQHHQHQLVIAGTGTTQEVQHLKSLIQNHPRITYIGKVDAIQRNKLYQSTTALVMSSRFETQPLTILEAWSFKKPLIYFHIPHLNWIPGANNYPVQAYDLPAFSAQITHVATHLEQAKQQGEQNYQSIQSYTWDHIAQQYKNLLYDIIIGYKS